MLDSKHIDTEHSTAVNKHSLAYLINWAQTVLWSLIRQSQSGQSLESLFELIITIAPLGARRVMTPQWEKREGKKTPKPSLRVYADYCCHHIKKTTCRWGRGGRQLAEMSVSPSPLKYRLETAFLKHESASKPLWWEGETLCICLLKVWDKPMITAQRAERQKSATVREPLQRGHLVTSHVESKSSWKPSLYMQRLTLTSYCG